MKSQKAKEFIDGCMAHLTVEMSDHAKWQLRAAMTHAAELAEQRNGGILHLLDRPERLHARSE